MALPKNIRIGPFDYEISYGTTIEGRGHTLSEQMKILISEGMTLQSEQETLLHEILHCCWWVAGLDDDKNEEAVVTGMSPVLYDTLTRRENKTVKLWLFGG